LSGVGIFVGLESMIILLYKPIICLGPRFAPESDAAHRLCVALTVQAPMGPTCLNRIYRLTARGCVRRRQSKQSDILRCSIPSLAPRLFGALSLSRHSSIGSNVLI
jgi:hypothetical protein